MTDDMEELFPIIALRGIAVFPKMIFSFDVGREKSLRALERAMSLDQRLVLLMQENIMADEPGPDDLYAYGVLVHVRQVLKMPNEGARILVEGITRVASIDFTKESPWLEGTFITMDDTHYRATQNTIEAQLRVAYQL